MEIITQGHTYELENMEGGVQQLQFIRKEALPDPQPDISRKLQTLTNGTTNEEVLRVLIDRMYFLQKKMSSRENSIVITKLEECLMWLEKRTRDREVRQVEGTNQK